MKKERGSGLALLTKALLLYYEAYHLVKGQRMEQITPKATKTEVPNAGTSV